MLTGTGAGVSLGEGESSSCPGKGCPTSGTWSSAPREHPSGQESVGAQRWVPRSIGQVWPHPHVPATLLPQWLPQLGGDVAPRRYGTLFWGDTCAPRQLRRDTFVWLAGKGLRPGEFWGAGMSPAGYTQAAPRTGDLTPLPWQRLVKSRRAGRLLRARGAGMGAWEAAPRPPRSAPAAPPQ